MSHRAELSFACASAGEAGLLEKAIAVDARDAPEGATVALRVREAELHAEVHAADLATLRAAVNSVARLADAALRTLQQAPAGS